MEIIRLLVQNLIVIIILSTFLEMLLPAGEMKRYTKLVMGLLVIITVLGALGSLLRGDWARELPEQAIGVRQPGAAGLSEIMASAKKVSQEHLKRAGEEYRRSLARQVSALAGLSGEVEVLWVEVDIYDEESNPKFGQVKEIRLAASGARLPAQERNTLAEPIKIEVGEQKKKESFVRERPDQAQCLSSAVKDKLKTTIANFYGLSQEQVKVFEGNQAPETKNREEG